MKAEQSDKNDAGDCGARTQRRAGHEIGNAQGNCRRVPQIRNVAESHKQGKRREDDMGGEAAAYVARVLQRLRLP